MGDTGSAEGPETQSLVADKMVSDFTEANAADVPSFFYHLGDVVYYFGEAPITTTSSMSRTESTRRPSSRFPETTTASCTPAIRLRRCRLSAELLLGGAGSLADAGGLVRTTMIQPGVYFTLEAPFVRILGVYSNVLEDPGVISDQNGTYSTLDERQLTFLKTALARVKSDNFTGAVIIATHHPPYTGASDHGGSPVMLQEIDDACQAAGVWPHAVFSGHAHNYQRFTRTVNNFRSRMWWREAAAMRRLAGCAQPIAPLTQSTAR